MVQMPREMHDIIEKLPAWMYSFVNRATQQDPPVLFLSYIEILAFFVICLKFETKHLYLTLYSQAQAYF